MGSYGSGRTGGRPASEACASYVLNASSFNRVRLKLGVHGTGPISFNDGFEISFTIDTRDEHHWFLTLGRAKRTGDIGQVRYQVQLV